MALGADLAFLSAYPEQQEMLYPPLTKDSHVQQYVVAVEWCLSGHPRSKGLLSGRRRYLRPTGNQLLETNGDAELTVVEVEPIIG